MNAEDYTPIDKTDKLLARLCKEGYLVRTKESDGNEEIVEFMVGPRGKVEVGSSGVAGLVREVYGRGRGAGAGAGEEGSTQLEREMRAEFEERLRRSLGIVGVREHEEEEEEEEQRREEERTVNGRGGAGEAVRSARTSEAPRRSSRRATTAHESEAESSSEESDTEDSVKYESD
jgi:hypothetical protein